MSSAREELTAEQLRPVTSSLLRAELILALSAHARDLTMRQIATLAHDVAESLLTSDHIDIDIELR